jgi:hypothetical protein
VQAVEQQEEGEEEERGEEQQQREEQQKEEMDQVDEEQREEVEGEQQQHPCISVPSPWSTVNASNAAATFFVEQNIFFENMHLFFAFFFFCSWFEISILMRKVFNKDHFPA